MTTTNDAPAPAPSDRDRIADIIQNAIAEHCSIDAIEMEIDGTGPASYKAADRILSALASE